MSIRYRIHIDSPRHRVQNEYFIEFRRNESGKESVHTDANRATWMNLEIARIALRRLREPKYGIRCQLLDEFGNVHSDYSEVSEQQPIDIFTSHETSVWRDRFEGKLIEIPLVYNRANRTYYLKFSTSPNPADPPDVSVAGTSPAEVFERFTANPFWRQYVDKFVIEDLLPSPEAAAAVAAGTPMITIPALAGTVIVGVRPGSIR